MHNAQWRKCKALESRRNLGRAEDKMTERRNVIKEKSFALAKSIVRVYKYLCEEKREYVLSKQLLRSGTSIGANVYESGRAVSKKDFVNKIGIALKEADETMYWLELLKETSYLSDEQFKKIYDECGEVCKILTSISKTAQKEEQ